MADKTIHASDANIAAQLQKLDTLVGHLDNDAVAVLLKNFTDGSGPVGHYHSLLAGNDVAEFTPSTLQNDFKKLAGDMHGKLGEMRTKLETAKGNILLAQAGLDTADQDASGQGKF